MKLLGIDTSTSVASVALAEDNEIVAENIYPPDSARGAASHLAKANHAEIVLPLVDAVLNRAGVRLPDISGLAVSVGPGSFTGLRIGLSTVKGLAYRSQTPIVGVSTLLANASSIVHWRGLICALLDARKQEVYAAVFRADVSGLARVTEDTVASMPRVVEILRAISPSSGWMFVGDGASRYRGLLEDTFGPQAHFKTGESPSVAAAVARLAHERLRRNHADSLDTLTPLYVRSSEAELRMAVGG